MAGGHGKEPAQKLAVHLAELVIEHNLDVIKCADRIVDLGPEGGERGGTVVAQGTPEEVAQVEGSYTGAFVKKMLEDGRL